MRKITTLYSEFIFLIYNKAYEAERFLSYGIGHKYKTRLITYCTEKGAKISSQPPTLFY